MGHALAFVAGGVTSFLRRPSKTGSQSLACGISSAVSPAVVPVKRVRRRQIEVMVQPDEDKSQTEFVSAVRKVFLTEVDVPLVAEPRTVKSGYLLAAAISAIFGGGSTALAFLVFLSLSTALEAPAILAAIASAVTSLLIELLRVNVAGIVGSRADSGDFVLGLIMFAAVLGVMYGIDPNASLEPTNASSFASSSSPEKQSNVTPRRRRDTVDDKERSKTLGASEQADFSQQLNKDLRQWDEKFLERNTSLEKTQDVVDGVP